MADAAAAGRLVDAAQIALEDCALANGEELAVMAEAGVAAFVAPNVPVHLRDHEYISYRFLESSRLERLTMPMLLLHGARTHPFYSSVVRHLAGQITDPHVRKIPDFGHMAPLLAPERVAEELTAFFAAAPART